MGPLTYRLTKQIVELKKNRSEAKLKQTLVIGKLYLKCGQREKCKNLCVNNNNTW